MQGDMHKVTAGHLKRMAYLYVRQSTPRQVLENTESTKRQYALRQRAIALGWHSDRIVVIDNDLGQSGSSATDREGFQRLVGEVSILPPPEFCVCGGKSLPRGEATVSPQAERWTARG